MYIEYTNIVIASFSTVYRAGDLASASNILVAMLSLFEALRMCSSTQSYFDHSYYGSEPFCIVCIMLKVIIHTRLTISSVNPTPAIMLHSSAWQL